MLQRRAHVLSDHIKYRCLAAWPVAQVSAFRTSLRCEATTFSKPGLTGSMIVPQSLSRRFWLLKPAGYLARQGRPAANRWVPGFVYSLCTCHSVSRMPGLFLQTALEPMPGPLHRRTESPNLMARGGLNRAVAENNPLLMLIVQAEMSAVPRRCRPNLGSNEKKVKFVFSRCFARVIDGRY